MNKKIKFIIKLLSLFIVLIISFYYINNNLDQFNKIFNLTIKYFIILSFITIIGLIVDGLLFKTVLYFFNIKLNYKEWFGLTVINRFSNYLLILWGLKFRQFSS